MESQSLRKFERNDGRLTESRGKLSSSCGWWSIIINQAAAIYYQKESVTLFLSFSLAAAALCRYCWRFIRYRERERQGNILGYCVLCGFWCDMGKTNKMWGLACFIVLSSISLLFLFYQLIIYPVDHLPWEMRAQRTGSDLVTQIFFFFWNVM